MDILLFVLAIIVMLIGFVGTILPVLPGIPVIFFGALGFSLLSDKLNTASDTIIILVILTLVSFLLDWLATALGVKRFGGNWVTMVGAVVGMLVGALVLNVVGIFVGAFLGAFVIEMMRGKVSADAAKTGMGAMIGVVFGTITKIALAATMIGFFTWAVWF